MTIDNSALDAQVVAHDLDQGERMIRRVYDFLGRFVSYPSTEARDAHALWILHSHLMDRWDSTPRLAFLSPEPMSGKSRALEITALLVPNPILSVNATPAYLFRKISSPDGLPTILFDEIDTVFGPKAKDNEEIRGVLNAGHHKGASSGRCVIRGKAVETEELPAYCAVAIAGLGWLPDTILTRSIIIRMRRRAPNEAVEPFRRRIHPKQAAPICEAVEAWARTIGDITWPELPEEIQDRDADVWESLIAIADLIGGEWPQRARKAAVALVSAGQDAEPSLGIRLLADIKVVFDDIGGDAIATKTLLRGLLDIEESPWGDLKGKPLDERGLARRLRQYSIKPATVYIPGHQPNPKGYRRTDCHDSWLRYLPSTPANSATSATTATVADFPKENGPDLLRMETPVADDPHPVADAEFNRNTISPIRSDTIAHVADVAASLGHALPPLDRCWLCKKRGEILQCSHEGVEFWAHSQCIDAYIQETRA